MTMLQKTLVAAAVVVLAGAGIYESRQAAQLRDQVQTIQQQQASLAEQIRHMQDERDHVINRLADLLAENARLKSKPSKDELLKLRREVALLKNQVDQTNDPTQSAAKSWLNRVNLLKQRLEQNSGAEIPELKLLSEEEWLATVKDLPLDSDRQYRVAMSNLRNAAESKFGNEINAALQKYLQVNYKKFPTDLGQLRDFFSEPVDSVMLERWQIVPGKAVNSDAGDWVITQKSAVDDVLDIRQVIAKDHYTRPSFLDERVSQKLDEFRSFREEGYR